MAVTRARGLAVAGPRGMPKNLERLSPRDDEGSWRVVIESPRGSTIKLTYDAVERAFVASRPLPLGLHYPYDWGFVPSTEGPDGDPIDALVLWDGVSAPGTVIPCRVVGLVELDQKKGERAGRQRNDRVLFVPVVSARDRLGDARELPARFREELAEFFVAASRLEGKEPRLLGVRGAREAELVLRRSLRGSWKRAA